MVSAEGPEFAAAIGKQGFGRCHQDVCSFFSIEAATPVGSAKDGILFVIAEKDWEASYKATDDDHEYDHRPLSMTKPSSKVSFVFCSKTRPTIFWYETAERHWDSSALRPGDDKSIFGANESAHTFYFAACHAYMTKDPYGLGGLAMKLGYKFGNTKTEDNHQQEYASPLDILK